MKILYVEDEIAHVELAQRTLADTFHDNFVLFHRESVRGALEFLAAEPDIDLVLTDLRLPDGSGLDLLKKIKERRSGPAVVLITGQGDQENAVAALKAGAADYLVKQSDYLHRLPIVISNAVAQNRLLREQTALHRAEIRYQSLVERTPAVVFLDAADEAETTLYISPRVEELTGYTPDEWREDLNIWINLIHPEDRKRIEEKDQRTHESGMRFQEEYRLIRRDGRIIWIKEDTTLVRDKDGNPLYWQGLLLDITKEKENETALQRQLEELAVLHSASIAASTAKSVDDLIAQVTNVIGNTLYPDNCGILLVDRNTHTLRPHPSYLGTDDLDLSRPIPITQGIAGRVAETGESARLGDVTKDPSYFEVTAGIQAELCVPIISRGQVIGVINAESKARDAFSKKDEQLLITIANTLATAIEKLSLFEEEQQRARELATLYQATRALTNSLEPEIIGQNLITIMEEQLNYELAFIFLLDDQGQFLTPVALSRKAQSPESYEKDMDYLRDGKLPLRQGIVGWVAQHGETIRSGDVSKEPHYLPVIKNIKSELCVPLIARGKVSGAINIESTQPDAYTDKDENLLTALANSAAIALDNARLYKSELARRQQAENLREATATLGTTLAFQPLLNTILDAIAQLVPYDSASIFLEHSQDEMEIVILRGLPNSESFLGKKIKKTNQWNDMALNRKGLIIPDTHTDSRFEKWEGTEYIRSWMSVPLIAQDKVIGHVNLDSFKANMFTERDATIAQTFANSAAIALGNARLYQDALRAAERRAVLHRISQDIVRFTQDSEQIYVAIHEAAAKLMPCDVFIVALRNEAKDENLSVYSVEAGYRYEPRSIPASQGLTGVVINEGKSIILRNEMEISKTEVFHFGSQSQVQSVVAIPMQIGEKAIGMISAQCYEPYAYGEEEQTLLEMLATHAATAIENARLFEEQGQRAKIIEALADIANEIATTREVIPALDQIAQRALDLLNANHVAIYLLQEDNVTLKTVTAHGIYRKELLSHTRKVGEGITGNIFLNGKPEIIHDTREDPRRIVVPGTPEEEKLETLMSSPLILRGKPIGVINAWRLKENGLFNESELNFLVSIAHQASICIESGRLFEETNRQAQEAAAIAEVGRDISATLELDIVLERIASYAMNLLQAETSAVYLADSSTSSLRAIAALGLDSEEIKNDPVPIGTGILGNIALQNAGEIINDAANDARAIPVKGTEQNQLEHIMAVPILLKERHTGLLAIWRSGAGTEFIPRELDFLTSLARQAAVAIENARLHNETQRRLKELETINRISMSLRVTYSVDEILPILLNETLELVNTPHGSIWLYDQASEKLVQRIATGAESKLKQTSLSPSEGIVGHTFTTGKRYISRELRTDPLLFYENQESTTPGLGGVCIPIQSTAGPVGVLMIALATGRQIFEELHLLAILAEITGNAIHRAGLYQQSQEQVRRLTTLRDVDAAIASSFDLRLTLNILMDQTLTHLAVDAVDIALYHPELQSLTYLTGGGFRTPAPTRPQLRIGEGLAGQVIIRQQMYQVANLLDSSEARKEPLIRREGFIAYIGIPLIVKGQIKGVFEVFHRSPLSPTPDWMEFLHTLAGQAAIAIDNAQLFENLQHSNQELVQAYDTTLEGWARALELRDRETEGHTRRVTDLTMRLAKYMGISDSEFVSMRRGVLLHDIGKMGVPDHILKKTGSLTPLEWNEMRQHPVYAYNLLSPITYLQDALDIPYCHHEHWDGSGYPRGLKGEQIPLSARIFSVVDIWDALLSDRPYRNAWLREKVIEYLQQISGTYLDPQIVEVFLKMIAEDESKTE
jgi:PAS domain S-box-containing protein